MKNLFIIILIVITNSSYCQSTIGIIGSKTSLVSINAQLALKANQTNISNINNTSDVNKPVSIAQQIALDSKFDKIGGTILGTVGIGVTTPVSKLQVNTGDIELGTIGNGIIITAPNGTRWRITINNTGNLATTSL